MGNQLCPVTIRAGFSSNPLASGQSWTDLSPLVKRLSTYSGRQRVLQETEPGTLTLLCRGETGILDPTNTTSAYYPNVAINKQVQICVQPNMLSAAMTNWVGGSSDWNSGNNVNCSMVFTGGYFNGISGAVALNGDATITATAGSDMSISTPNGSAGFRVLPDADYRISAVCSRVSGSPSRNSTLTMTWYDSTGASISTSANTAAEATNSFSATSPPTAYYAKLTVAIVSPGAGESHKIQYPQVLNGNVSSDLGYVLAGGPIPLFTGWIDSVSPVYHGNMRGDVIITASDVLRICNDTYMPADSYAGSARANLLGYVGDPNVQGQSGAGCVLELGDTTTGSVARDSSINGYNGTVQGSYAWGGAARNATCANTNLVLSGLGGGVSIPNTAAPNGGAGANLLTHNQATVAFSATGFVNDTNVTVSKQNDPTFSSASLRMRSSASGNMVATTTAGTGGFAVSPSTQYTAGLNYETGVSARSCNAGIRWYTAAGATISTSTGSDITDSTSALTPATVTATSPSNAAFAAVVATVKSTGAANEDHYAASWYCRPGPLTTWDTPAKCGEWSVGISFKTSTATQTLYAQGPTGAVEISMTITAGGKLQAAIGGAAGSQTLGPSTNSVNDGAWHLATLEYDGTILTLSLVDKGESFTATTDIKLTTPSSKQVFGATAGDVVPTFIGSMGPLITTQSADINLSGNLGYWQTYFSSPPGPTAVTAEQTIAVSMQDIGTAISYEAVDSGQSVAALPTAPLNGSTVLAYLNSLAETESGFLVPLNGGWLTLWDRYHWINSTAQAGPQIGSANPTAIGDNTLGKKEIGILGDPEVGYDTVDFYNSASVTRVGGTTAEVAFATGTSRTQYGVQKTFTESGLLITTDAEALARAQYNVRQFGSPQLRWRSVTVNPVTHPNAAVLIAAGNSASTRGVGDSLGYSSLTQGWGLGEFVTIVKRPYTSGSGFSTWTTSQLAVCEGIEHSIDLENRTWKTNLRLSPTDDIAYWLLGTSALDTQTVLAY
jgi:hypothetical protein